MHESANSVISNPNLLQTVALLEFPILQSLARLLSKSRLALGAGLRDLAAAAYRRNDAICCVTTRRVETRGPGRVE